MTCHPVDCFSVSCTILCKSNSKENDNGNVKSGRRRRTSKRYAKLASTETSVTNKSNICEQQQQQKLSYPYDQY